MSTFVFPLSSPIVVLIVMWCSSAKSLSQDHLLTFSSVLLLLFWNSFPLDSLSWLFPLSSWFSSPSPSLIIPFVIDASLKILSLGFPSLTVCDNVTHYKSCLMDPLSYYFSFIMLLLCICTNPSYFLCGKWFECMFLINILTLMCSAPSSSWVRWLPSLVQI